MKFEWKKKIKLPARASICYIACGILTKGTGLLLTPFFTRLQSESDYGSFTLYMSVLGAASVISSAFSSGSSVYRGLAEFREKKSEYLSSVLSSSLLFSLVICTLLFAFSRFLALGYGIITAICIQLICDCIVSVRMSEAKFHYRYREVVGVTVLQTILSSLSAIFIIYTMGGGYTVRVFSMLFVSIATALYALVKILAAAKPKKDMVLYSLKSSLPLLPRSVESALSSQADKLIFTALLGTVSLARYSVVHSLGIGLSFIITALGSALAPWIIRRLNAREGERIAEICMPLFKAIAAATVFVIAISPEAMLILAPPEYSEAISAILPISLSVIPSLFLSLGTVVLINRGKSQGTAYASLVTVGSGILLSLILIPTLRYFGAGLSLLLSQIMGALAIAFSLRRVGVVEIFPIRSILSYFSLAALLGGLALLLYDYPALRILLLTLPAVLLLNSFFSAERLVRE